MIPAFGSINNSFSGIVFNEKTFIEFFNERKKMLHKKAHDIDNQKNIVLKNFDDLEISLENDYYSISKYDNKRLT